MSPEAQMLISSVVLEGYRNVRRMGHGGETGKWDMPLKVIIDFYFLLCFLSTMR